MKGPWASRGLQSTAASLHGKGHPQRWPCNTERLKQPHILGPEARQLGLPSYQLNCRGNVWYITQHLRRVQEKAETCSLSKNPIKAHIGHVPLTSDVRETARLHWCCRSVVPLWAQSPTAQLWGTQSTWKALLKLLATACHTLTNSTSVLSLYSNYLTSVILSFGVTHLE